MHLFLDGALYKFAITITVSRARGARSKLRPNEPNPLNVTLFRHGDRFLFYTGRVLPTRKSFCSPPFLSDDHNQIDHIDSGGRADGRMDPKLQPSDTSEDQFVIVIVGPFAQTTEDRSYDIEIGLRNVLLLVRLDQHLSFYTISC